MSIVPHICVVCYRSTVAFNYGVTCCNACKMFFRRALNSKKAKICLFEKTCFDAPIPNLDCRYCRFQQCIRAGMRANLALEAHVSSKFDGLSLLIRNLSYLDSNRQAKFLNCHVPGDPSLDQVFLENIDFRKKEIGANFKFFDWGFMEQLTTIDFMKHLEFLRVLNPKDQRIYLKEAYFKFVIFQTSMRSYSWKMDTAIYPDGTDIFPEGISTSPHYSPLLLNKIRRRINGRLCELNVSHEEFLLASVVLFCNPAIANLSDSARTLISSYQKTYSSALFQYCLINYQSGGPSRFTDLLSLCTVINQTFDDISAFNVLFKFYEPREKIRRFFLDLFEFIS